MGWMAERFGIRRVVMFGASMVAAGLAISTSGGCGRALYRARRVYRPARQCLHQRAALRLCRALVRPASRQRRRADLVGPVSRRHRLAGLLHARHRGPGLARHDAGLCRLRRRHNSPGGARRLPAAARRRQHRRRGRPRTRRRRARTAPQSGDGPAVLRRADVLRPDGDAAGPSGRVLHRCRDRPGAWRGDAVGAARLRLRQPAVLGAGSPTASAGCARCWPARCARSRR